MTDPDGMAARPGWRAALARSMILERLAAFDPRVIGTLPLGVAVPGSDVDIAAFAPDPDAVADILWAIRDRLAGLTLHRWTGGGRPLVARFGSDGWPFEIFAAPLPVERQAGWRHFAAERRLLALGGAAFAQAVRARRAAGLKTEPAFAATLALAGDPYAAMLALADADDTVLQALLGANGFSRTAPMEAGERT